MKKRGILVSLILVAAAGGLSIATPDPAPPAGTRGTVIVPERFLRRWDPVTVFFNRPIGPKGGGPEDHPEKLLAMTPAHPGAYSWLDRKTLQFRPAEPWPALQRVRIRLKRGGGAALATLMSPPIRTIPRDGSDDLEPVDAVTLTFAQPVPPASLAKMTRIELRKRPGLDAARARWLDADDFEVKRMERRSPSDPATYVLQLSEPIREGTRAIVHFQLSLDDRDQEAFADVSFSTLESFRMVTFGCSGGRLPATPEGSTYGAEQALRCRGSGRNLELVFSSEPSAVDPLLAKNLVRFTPAVENLTFSTSGRTLSVAGRFEVEKRYEMSVYPTALTDTRGRKLDMGGPSRLSFYFPRKQRYLKLKESKGVVERYGPQTVPLEGRGFDRVDVRIYRVDPLDRLWWPFADAPVVVDESKRPPGPGEEPATEVKPYFAPTVATLREQLRTLGAPSLSRIVELPIGRRGAGARFGLDLEPHLAHLAGRKRPGHYLVGVRRLDGSHDRHWMRLQVTDLALSVMEEPHAVRFYVTSLATGRPVSGAKVRVEGTKKNEWVTHFSGTTGRGGSVRWVPTGFEPYVNKSVRRIVVERAGDVLVLDPNRAPDRFEKERWQAGRHSGWLQWAVTSHVGQRGDQPKTLCHLFTERPVYRPEEQVHIKGYLRKRHEGALTKIRSMEGLMIEVRGSGDLSWRLPVTLTDAGSVYQTFREEGLPTGVYTATLMTKRRGRLCSVNFRMEAYRIPKFEVQLHGPSSAPLDRPFEVKMTASYYAGGPVASRPVRWRVTQFPYTWSPPRPLDGFFYSTDSRFSRSGRFQSTPNADRQEITGERGGSRLELNPALEPTAQPRTYVVEATVTGADEQTVTATKQVRSLPPFVLGLAVPRFLEKAEKIRPRVVAVDSKGRAIAGKEVVVRLIHRTWHSHLQASDFSDGAAKYITDVVDERILERKVKTAEKPIRVDLPLEESGVYVVEIEARDRLGRAQVVSVDLFAGGDEAVSWKKPEDKVFEVSTDRASYAPGETAKFLLKSPFLEARALAVVEGPDENSYHWLDVEGGVATFSHRVKKNEVPRLPVHFVLIRGRITSAPPRRNGSADDLGKPVTMAATKWIDVTPVEHRLQVKLDHPARAQPGQKVKVKISLSDRRNRPRPGEVTLWLVDQAVLALGREQKLDPLGSFITPARSYLAVADTRNDVFGRLPLAENPGGGAPAEEESAQAEGLLDKVTVRKNFESVPVFLPRVAVGKRGKTTVEIELPDNLTNFKIRAKAVSGNDRFGYAKGTIEVRLPVIVQPALPRFVRTGDRFEAAGIARIVEGGAGAGRAELRVENAKVAGRTKRKVTLVKNRPVVVGFDVTTDSVRFHRDPEKHPRMNLTLGVERSGDGAKDAFSVSLPIRPDRVIERRRIMKEVGPSEALEIAGLDEPARPGTMSRTIFVSTEPALVKMAAGLDYLLAYPHGSTEVRISRARAFLATRRFRETLKLDMDEAHIRRAVEETLEWLVQVTDSNGLASNWPGARPYVWLTADAVQLMLEAEQAGYHVDRKTYDRSMGALKRALRSDYRYFISAEKWTERTLALEALARANRFDPSYAAELARKSQYLNLESIAGVAQAFVAAGRGTNPVVERLAGRMWNGVVFRLHQGKEIYGGLQGLHGSRSALILPSETRTVAELLMALDGVDPKQEKLRILTDALVTLGRGDGWGTTNANASALAALNQRLKPGRNRPTSQVRITRGGRRTTLRLGPDAPAAVDRRDAVKPLRIEVSGAKVLVRVETSWVPAAPGSAVEAASRGFVVTRRHLQIQPKGPPVKVPIDEGNRTVELKTGDVVEEHIQLVNPKERHYVVVTVPLAAGVDPLNPNLATSPPEARPNGRDTLAPTHLAFLDDRVDYYFETLPKGTYDFYFRTRATTPGRFVQPPARTEMMYDGTVVGHSPGAEVRIRRGEER